MFSEPTSLVKVYIISLNSPTFAISFLFLIQFIKMFQLGWFANPVFSKEGDYPQTMKDKIAQNSLEQGYPRSRLLEFTPEEIAYLKGTYDFFGLNHYTTAMVKHKSLTLTIPSLLDDVSAEIYHDPTWPLSASIWLKVCIIHCPLQSIICKFVHYNKLGFRWCPGGLGICSIGSGKVTIIRRSWYLRTAILTKIIRMTSIALVITISI